MLYAATRARGYNVAGFNRHSGPCFGVDCNKHNPNPSFAPQASGFFSFARYGFQPARNPRNCAIFCVFVPVNVRTDIVEAVPLVVLRRDIHQ